MAPDLKLLVVFDAVYESGSVTAAAKKLSLSQPAVSHALNRLRDVLTDPLFVRSRRGLTPTARARDLAARVRNVVTEARELLAPMEFDPLKSTRRFVIGSSDYAALTLAPGLMATVRKLAPGITLLFESVGQQTFQQLEEGVFDLSFWGARPPKLPWHWQNLFEEDHVGLMAHDHPFAGVVQNGSFGLQNYVACPHITVSMQTPGGNRVDEALHRLGHARAIAATTHSFSGAVQALKNSDLIATMPKRLALGDIGKGYLMFQLPFEVPSYSYGLVWHRRAQVDQGLIWLREQIGYHV